MLAMLLSFLRSFRVYFQSRADLQTEILALRHQIVVLKRQAPKPKLKPTDRMILGRSFTVLIGALDRETRYRYRLASSRVPLVLDLEGSTWTPRAAMRSE